LREGFLVSALITATADMPIPISAFTNSIIVIPHALFRKITSAMMPGLKYPHESFFFIDSDNELFMLQTPNYSDIKPEQPKRPPTCISVSGELPIRISSEDVKGTYNPGFLIETRAEVITVEAGSDEAITNLQMRYVKLEAKVGEWIDRVKENESRYDDQNGDLKKLEEKVDEQQIRLDKLRSNNRELYQQAWKAVGRTSDDLDKFETKVTLWEQRLEILEAREQERSVNTRLLPNTEENFETVCPRCGEPSNPAFPNCSHNEMTSIKIPGMRWLTLPANKYRQEINAAFRPSKMSEIHVGRDHALVTTDELEQIYRWLKGIFEPQRSINAIPQVCAGCGTLFSDGTCACSINR
jgi:hypothetical protein